MPLPGASNPACDAIEKDESDKSDDEADRVLRLGKHCADSSEDERVLGALRLLRWMFTAPVESEAGGMCTASGPVDAAGIAATLGIMDVDIADVRVRKHLLYDLLDFGTLNHVSVQHHADLIETT